ncbi:hypothetical protein BDZ89DRAFT_1069182 [Hymenopellis radicata]|nr:hypothetical protein BDZ89DRAFT_1069182 [Hymenopellis radicata]
MAGDHRMSDATAGFILPKITKREEQIRGQGTTTSGRVMTDRLENEEANSRY